MQAGRASLSGFLSFPFSPCVFGRARRPGAPFSLFAKLPWERHTWAVRGRVSPCGASFFPRDGKETKGSPGDAADGHCVPLGPLTPGPPFTGTPIRPNFWFSQRRGWWRDGFPRSFRCRSMVVDGSAVPRAPESAPFGAVGPKPRGGANNSPPRQKSSPLTGELPAKSAEGVTLEGRFAACGWNFFFSPFVGTALCGRPPSGFLLFLSLCIYLVGRDDSARRFPVL